MTVFWIVLVLPLLIHPSPPFAPKVGNLQALFDPSFKLETRLPAAVLERVRRPYKHLGSRIPAYIASLGGTQRLLKAESNENTKPPSRLRNFFAQPCLRNPLHGVARTSWLFGCRREENRDTWWLGLGLLRLSPSYYFHCCDSYTSCPDLGGPLYMKRTIWDSRIWAGGWTEATGITINLQIVS